MLWGAFNVWRVLRVKIDPERVEVNTDEHDKNDPEKANLPWTK